MGLFGKLFGDKSDSKTVNETPKTVAQQATIGFRYKGELNEVPYYGPNDSLLDSILNAGYDIPFSCQGGTCGTCNCKLNEGDIIEASGMEALNSSERKKGYTLACSAKPASDRVTIDFDDYIL